MNNKEYSRRLGLRLMAALKLPSLFAGIVQGDLVVATQGVGSVEISVSVPTDAEDWQRTEDRLLRMLRAAV